VQDTTESDRKGERCRGEGGGPAAAKKFHRGKEELAEKSDCFLKRGETGEKDLSRGGKERWSQGGIATGTLNVGELNLDGTVTRKKREEKNINRNEKNGRSEGEGEFIDEHTT